MATQHFKRNLLLNLYREGKTYHWFVSSCRLREIKMSGTCSLFPPFGDPWPSCLLPSQIHLQCRRFWFDPWVGKIPWRREWQLTPVFYLENPMDRGASWALVHRVTQSRTRLKRLGTAHRYSDKCSYFWCFYYCYYYIQI